MKRATLDYVSQLVADVARMRGPTRRLANSVDSDNSARRLPPTKFIWGLGLLLIAVFHADLRGQQTAPVATEEAASSEEAAWKAIDGRPTPQWWRDAKFGIFIHWGPYSVPAFSPQFKDVVTKYQPAVIFSDGEWDHPAATWKSSEMLTWLFNDSSCKDEVVINDRWGKGDRHKHGGYYTTEYGAGLANAENPWEENRGMAHSFGYSRTEHFEDYNSTETLVLMLVDIVSRGGNFLLDIGPTADGRIPPLMEERLAEIGDWLEVNGEAIYGTTTHRETCQWTDGKVQGLDSGTFRVKYDVNKLLKNPDEGMARKEALFTRKGSAIYAICPVLPDEQLALEGITASGSANVTLLGVGRLQWKQSGEDLVITMPRLNPSRMPCRHAWTFKVSAIED